jgi:hypothetical protein
MFADLFLDALLSSPEDKVHLRWTNIKDSMDEKECPDGIIALKSQSRWDRNYGHGEAKIGEARDNFNVLVWDLHRLAYFNKTLINTTDTNMAFAFQVKGIPIYLLILLNL